MKILILANHDLGLYQFRKELIQELLKENEVFISLPDGEFIKNFKQMGCGFIDTKIDRRGINPKKDISLLASYYRMIKRVKPDLVITYTIKPNIYGGMICRLLKIKYVVNITGLGTAFEKDGLLRKFVTKLYSIACKKAKIVFFENEENRRTFIQNKIVKESKTYRLNGAGVNLSHYKVLDYPKGENIKFLFMGRVMAEKGIDELFQAMKKLVNSGVNCELTVLGQYEENYKEIISKYEEEGWLHYYGYQKDVCPFINNSHCFVLPSWHEGMANTNLECAASARPIITSNIAGCKEAVIENVSGFLAQSKNADDLFVQMKKFTELTYEEQKKMGLEGRRHMENTFDKNKVVETTIKKIFE